MSRSLYDVVVFFLNECLKGPVTDGPHGVVGDGGDEDGEELVLAGLDDQTLVVLRAGEHLRHRVLALNRIILCKYTVCCDMILFSEEFFFVTIFVFRKNMPE